MISANSMTVPILSGHITARRVLDAISVEDALSKTGEVILNKSNLVVAGAQQAIIGLLKGQSDLFTPSFITLGSGGDYEQESSTDTGSRVGPLYTDTSLRIVESRIPILYADDGDTPTSWKYVAVARPHEALTAGFNELGVETENGTLISHFITEADETTRAVKYTKTSLEYLIVEWTYSLLLATPTSYITATENVNSGLLRSASGGSNPLNASVPAFIQPGATTTLAVVSTTSTAQIGDLTLQEGSVIRAELVDGSSAIIILEQI